MFILAFHEKHGLIGFQSFSYWVRRQEVSGSILFLSPLKCHTDFLLNRSNPQLSWISMCPHCIGVSFVSFPASWHLPDPSRHTRQTHELLKWPCDVQSVSSSSQPELSPGSDDDDSDSELHKSFVAAFQVSVSKLNKMDKAVRYTSQYFCVALHFLLSVVCTEEERGFGGPWWMEAH